MTMLPFVVVFGRACVKQSVHSITAAAIVSSIGGGGTLGHHRVCSTTVRRSKPGQASVGPNRALGYFRVKLTVDGVAWSFCYGVDLTSWGGTHLACTVNLGTTEAGGQRPRFLFGMLVPAYRRSSVLRSVGG